jgi:hypothetical protein
MTVCRGLLTGRARAGIMAPRQDRVITLALTGWVPPPGSGVEPIGEVV